MTTLTSDLCRRALEICGPVEWKQGYISLVLTVSESGLFWIDEGRDSTRGVTKHEAAALIERHLREWLEVRYINVVSCSRGYYVADFNSNILRVTGQFINCGRASEEVAYYHTYLEALIAAVIAAKEQMK
jgi:hypothetical protein